MKRSLLGICGSLVATVVLAQGPVTSVNVVGFNKHSLEKGKLYLIASAFEDIDGNRLSANEVIGKQLPNGSQVHFYDGVTPYKTDTLGLSGWGQTNITFRGFMGFWVKVAAPQTTQQVWDVVFNGQVPMANSASNVVVSGLNMLGFPYTADVDFTNTALYAQAFNGDQLHVYNTASNNYKTYTKTFSGWPADAKALKLTQGLGFWYKSGRSTPVLDVEARPYPANN